MKIARTFFRVVLTALLGLFAHVNSSSAQTWVLSTNAPSEYWDTVASSADGTKIVAASYWITSSNHYGHVAISADAGVTWTTRVVRAAAWAHVASSADGTKLAVAEERGFVFLSTDSGATWNSLPGAGNWWGLACSADANKIAGVSQGTPSPGGVYSFTNFPGIWTWTGAPQDPIHTLAVSNDVPLAPWEGVAMSADGTRIVAVGNEVVYTSVNSGNAWVPQNVPAYDWWSVAASVDGAKLVAVAGGAIFTSTDSGATWVQTSAPIAQWAQVASSADGTKLVGAVYGGGIYTSVDSGLTWSSNNAPATNWFSVASSADGKKLVAVVFGGGIYTAQVPIVELPALEVTQVIQDWSNSIPLIAGKETYVRAHLQLPITNWGPAKVSGARLHGAGPGGPLAGSPLSPINAGGSLTVANVTNAAGAAIRGQLTNSLNFRLPPAWTVGTVSLQLVWTNDGILAPVNVVPTNATVAVTFVPALTPRVKFFAINWTNAAGTLQSVGTAALDDLSRRLLSCYPVAGVDASQGTITWPVAGARPTTQDVNTKLTTLRALDVAANTNVVRPLGNRVYYGAIPQNAVVGEADAIPGFISSGCLPPNPYAIGRHTHSHEIGHNLGRNHDVSQALFGTVTDSTGTYAKGRCGEAGDLNYVYPLFQPLNGSLRPALGPLTNGNNALIYGLDTLTLKQFPATNPVVDPKVYFDFMGYCSVAPLDFWPSSFTYTNLLPIINAKFIPSAGLPHPNGGGGGGGLFLIVRGTVDFAAGTAQFLPFLTLSSSAAPPAPPPGSNFVLLALDSSQSVLQQVEFTLTKSIAEFGDTSQTADFIVPMTENASLHSIQLWANGVLLATTTASPHAPTVILSSPNGGQVYTTGPVNVAWSGSDADLDPLIYTIQYSADNGVTWQTLDTDVPGPPFQVDSQELAATTNGLIRVMASDGFNTGMAQSATTFIVKPHAPRLSLSTPLDGAVFVADQQLFLEVEVSDMQDGTLAVANIQWTSSIEGPLGSGAVVNFETTRLVEGYHTITVTATDSAGLTNSAVTHIYALYQPPPTLAIAVTGTQAFLSWPTSYTNYVLQSRGTLGTGWSGVTNAPIIGGDQQTVPVNLSGTNRFFRLLFKP